MTVFTYCTPDETQVCLGSPEDLQVPLYENNQTGVIIHWTTEENCITVTYHSGLEEKLVMIQAALDAWNQISCSTLCFGIPSLQKIPFDPSTAERHLHLTTDKLSDKDIIITTSLTYDNDNGRLFNAILEINTTHLQNLTPADLTHHIGLAVPLSAVTGDIDSIMAIPIHASLNKPTSNDQKSICRLYGQDPYCRD